MQYNSTSVLRFGVLVETEVREGLAFIGIFDCMQNISGYRFSFNTDKNNDFHLILYRNDELKEKNGIVLENFGSSTSFPTSEC